MDPSFWDRLKADNVGKASETVLLDNAIENLKLCVFDIGPGKLEQKIVRFGSVPFFSYLNLSQLFTDLLNPFL